MNYVFSEVLNVIFAVAIVIGAFVISYFKTNSKFKDKIAALCNYAESQFDKGADKKQYVIDTIYSIVPIALKPILNKTIIGMMVQSTFDSIEEYAKKQLDKTTNKIGNEIDKITGNSDNIVPETKVESTEMVSNSSPAVPVNPEVK